jgi:hypothetical protein
MGLGRSSIAELTTEDLLIPDAFRRGLGETESFAGPRAAP